MAVIFRHSPSPRIGPGRYLPQIETAIYFCALEALQNVAKYAQASAAQVTLCDDGPCLMFTVTDDGSGFDQATTPIGQPSIHR